MARSDSPQASGTRSVVAICPVAPVPVRCIQVGSPSHLYLAGDSMIPTHNSALALSIAQHVAAQDHKPVIIFSLEMSKMELVQRLMCSEARVDSNRLRRGALQDSDWPKLSLALGRLAEAPIFIDDTPNATIMEMRAKCRRVASKSGLGLVIIDYLQLMAPLRRTDNRVQEVSEISRSLKILARELDVPVIALSQLSRNVEYRADKRPLLADLRESGSIEQDADVVMFIYRDEVYHPDSPQRGIAEIHISKHRSGPIGKVELTFLEHYTKFANLARGM
jgi:replicative DNA helicase